MTHKRNISGLIPAKKGEVRNPKGINGFSKWRDFAGKNLTEKDMAAILETIARLAKKGNLQAGTYLIDKIYGKTPETHNIRKLHTIDDVRQYLADKISKEDRPTESSKNDSGNVPGDGRSAVL
jgi:hypothetical protein